MFKKTKTIGLLGVGLLVMLGTKAEAHYVYANGYWYYHSLDCRVTIGDIPLIQDPLIVMCFVTTGLVEAKCQSGPIVSLPIQVSLPVAQVQLIPPWGSNVILTVDDTPLLSNLSIVSACGGLVDAVLIRKMASIVTIQCIGPSSTCSLPLTSTGMAVATCTLPAQCTLNSCPANKRTYTQTSVIHTN